LRRIRHAAFFCLPFRHREYDYYRSCNSLSPLALCIPAHSVNILDPTTRLSGSAVTGLTAGKLPDVDS
jgi:hypothetical protein